MLIARRSRGMAAVMAAAAVIAAATLAGCAAGAPDAGSGTQQSRTVRSLAPVPRSAGIPSALVSRAGAGGHACPSADRGSGVGTATFTFDRTNRISLTQDACPVTEAIVGHPELSYSGPAGCRGQFFAGDGTVANPSAGLVDWFRYGARDAYLVRFGGQIYHFPSAPRIRHRELLFEHDFGPEQISVTISCPPPRPSGWLLPPSA